MPFRKPGASRLASHRLAIVAVFAAVLTSGCRPPEGVSKYTAPKDPIDLDLISDEPGPGDDSVRVLGAIVEGDSPDQWNFLKFQPANSGGFYPPKALARHKPEFDAFVASLKFPKDGPMKWTVPAGWKSVEVRTGIPRLATFRMKKSETIVDLAISQIGGVLLENINRWRVQQAGVDGIKESEIATVYPPRTIDGRKVWIVDVSGPGPKPGAGMVPPFAK